MSVKAEEMPEDKPIDAVQVQENLWSVSLHNLMRAIGICLTYEGLKHPSFFKINIGFCQIRPCFLYKEEYDDCKSLKARFHQYFIHGESTDCLQWKRDYDSCVRFEENANDLKAAEEIIVSEAKRREDRLRPHFQNTTWKKRNQPPGEWAKPLPEWLQEKNKNTYLEVKANELREAEVGGMPKDERTLCVIM